MPQLPDYLKTRSDQGVGKKLAGSLGAGSPARLSILGGRFTLKDSAGSELPVETLEQGVPYVDVVIVDALERRSKLFFANTYDGSGIPPDCFSDNGVAPSRQAQSPQHTTCSGCPKNEWTEVSKTDPSKRRKACSDYQKLGILVPPHQGIYLFMVPPNSLKGLRDYMTKFGSHEMDPSDVITRVSFAKGVLGTLTFRGIDLIKPDVAMRRNELLEAHAADQMLGRMDQPITGAVPAITSSVPVQESGFKIEALGPMTTYPASETVISALPTAQISPHPEHPTLAIPASRRPGRPRKAAASEGNGAPPQAPFPTEASKPASAIEETLNDIFK
jgi:hypothetical protein